MCKLQMRKYIDNHTLTFLNSELFFSVIIPEYTSREILIS